jgi:hypothetical protein
LRLRCTLFSLILVCVWEQACFLCFFDPFNYIA